MIAIEGKACDRITIAYLASSGKVDIITSGHTTKLLASQTIVL